MRVLHLPSQVGGNAWYLSRGERAYGITSDVFYLENDPFFRHMSDVEFQIPISHGRIKRLAKTWEFYKHVIDDYDVFHFNFGSTLMNVPKWAKPLEMCDLKYLKRRGKIVAVTYQGDDARQADYCIDHYPINYFSQLPKDMLEMRLNRCSQTRDRIKIVDRYADLIYATNPDLINVLPKRARFRPYTKLDISKYSAHYSDYEKTELIVVHAPTDRLVKGTRYVIDAVSKLKSEGIPICLKLIEGMINREALIEYQNADIIVDQLFAGWYGGFAVECMAMGKPVIAYIREEDLQNIPAAMKEDLPIINATAKTLYDVLKTTYQEKDKLLSIAKRSRAYVERHHNHIAIAGNIIDDYKVSFTSR